MDQSGPDVKAIFMAALDRQPGAERAAYLEAACGANAELKQRLEVLLLAHEQAGEFFNEAASLDTADGPDSAATLADPRSTAAEATATQTSVSAQGPGSAEATVAHTDGPAGNGLSRGTVVRYFGDYEIESELGRGGMGVVYRARQVSLNRPVALKMIKAGLLASSDELRRFQNEAEAVALLDHQGIVPVYEVGDHEGQRYLTMKLVPVGSLVPRLTSYRNDPRAIAVLVAEAAEAVHHAHMRGILHRDLKPANILVDEEGHPYVTDFGLAKRVEDDAGLTLSGELLGTPAYMAPEQATGRRGSVTTATDVHGLGSVLYALLTGKAPFSGDSVIDTLQAVKEQPPEPPRKLNERVPRDLEVICLKCLEKDPRRRYSSAQAVADDLRAWLDSRPIAARPVGALTRSWLWCRRKPAVAALMAAVALLVVGGTATVITVQARANAELAAANRQVEARFALAMDAIKTFHTGVSDDVLLKQKEFEELRGKLLGGARDFYRRLEGLLKGQPSRPSRRALGLAYNEVAGLIEKIASREDALAVHQQALAVRMALLKDSPVTPEAVADVSESLVAIGWLLYQTGHQDKALKSLEEAKRLLVSLPGLETGDDRIPGTLGVCWLRIGIVQAEAGRETDALNSYERAKAILEAHVKFLHMNTRLGNYLAGIHNNIGWVRSHTSHSSEAVSSYKRAIEIREAMLKANPTDTPVRGALAGSQNNLGWLELQAGHPDEAWAWLERARENLEMAVKTNPTVTQYQRDLAVTHSYRGMVQMQTEHLMEALAAHEQAKAIGETLVRTNPSVTTFQNDLASIQSRIASLKCRTGQPAEALAWYDQALAIQESLVASNPEVQAFRAGLAETLNDIASLLNSTADPAATLATVERAIELQVRLCKESPDALDYRSRLVGLLCIRANLRQRVGQPAAALADFRQAVAIMKERPLSSALAFYEQARVYALFSAFAAESSSGLSSAAARTITDRAMQRLRDTIAAGYKDLRDLRTNPDLAALRDRSDFQALLMDIAMPSELFAQ